MNKIPSNWRKLKTNEKFRKGDLCHRAAPDRVAVDWDCNETIKQFHKTNPKYVFYRKRVKPLKSNKTDFKNLVLVPKKDTNNNTVVTLVGFEYPDSKLTFLRHRTVQVISMDNRYLVGLERSNNTKENGKYSWQFKKYLRSKIPAGMPTLMHYGKSYIN